MILTAYVSRSVTFDTGDYRTRFDDDESDELIVMRLVTDNGQFTHFLGDVFGWVNESLSVTQAHDDHEGVCRVCGSIYDYRDGCLACLGDAYDRVGEVWQR